jgi:glycosyltransferase involved in cell wall biosynthesis
MRMARGATPAGALPPGLPLCTDARLSARGDDGVSRYSQELGAAMRLIDPSLWLLHDRFTIAGTGKSRLERWRRWLETRRYVTDYPVVPDQDGRLVGRDVFRRLNVHFDRFGEVTTLQPSGMTCGIAHWSYPMPVRMKGWINIYTVHDTVPFDAPALTDIDPARHRRVLDAIAPGAAAFATVSEAAQADLQRWFGDGIAIVDCGQSVTPVPPTADMLPAGLTSGGYYLFCGREEARKNVPRLIAAWRQSGAKRPLVLVGPGQIAGVEDGLVRLPVQAGAMLSALQAGARALLFPSLVEGFGRPIAEAMVLGTAVLTSRGHATQEVAGDAALLVDPIDTAAIAAGIAALDTDDALVAGLIAAGQERAPAFSCARFAERLSTLYASSIVKAVSHP